VNANHNTDERKRPELTIRALLSEGYWGAQRNQKDDHVHDKTNQAKHWETRAP
jgi:hypothetical protein